MSLGVGSPQTLHDRKSRCLSVASAVCESLSMDRAIVYFIPGCFSSSLFSITLMSPLNASCPCGHGIVWNRSPDEYAYNVVSLSGSSARGLILGTNPAGALVVEREFWRIRSTSPCKMFIRACLCFVVKIVCRRQFRGSEFHRAFIECLSSQDPTVGAGLQFILLCGHIIHCYPE